MAATSVRGRPATINVGTLPSGFSARYSGERSSFLLNDLRFASKGPPISCSVICTANQLDPGAKYRVSMGPSQQVLSSLIRQSHIILRRSEERRVGKECRSR